MIIIAVLKDHFCSGKEGELEAGRTLSITRAEKPQVSGLSSKAEWL